MSCRTDKQVIDTRTDAHTDEGNGSIPRPKLALGKKAGFIQFWLAWRQFGANFADARHAWVCYKRWQIETTMAYLPNRKQACIGIAQPVLQVPTLL